MPAISIYGFNKTARGWAKPGTQTQVRPRSTSAHGKLSIGYAEATVCPRSSPSIGSTMRRAVRVPIALAGGRSACTHIPAGNDVGTFGFTQFSQEPRLNSSKGGFSD